ncbi:amylo-alpha-1,6-glucosidase [Halomicrococcus sp. NG-SE-24]|uniref:amylo-alpha-1,6-glucosidase n=1 Tax=Halomicrococcus sp. NG-SE-24 TaxID=3436928 RepID=UPI003D968C1E
MHPDGTHPDGPIAVAEAQGYYYDAKRRAADLARTLFDDERARRLEAEADELARSFDDAFWLPEESFYAVALDGRNDPVETVASNPGHCLWSGIVPDDRLRSVVDRLVADDMFTGWGIRTVSSDHRVYNPESYHLGSVWPHDNSLVALGMARYGRTDAARTVAQGLVDAAVARGNDRFPELFAGFERDDTDVPLPYGAACEPQAWAAGAPIACLRAVRGDGLWTPTR